MRRLSALFALTVLATTIALAQQATPQSPPASTNPQGQSPSTQPSDPSAGTSNESSNADKQAMMKACMTQIQAANPSVLAKDVKNFCDKEINRPRPQD